MVRTTRVVSRKARGIRMGIRMVIILRMVTIPRTVTICCQDLLIYLEIVDKIEEVKLSIFEKCHAQVF